MLYNFNKLIISKILSLETENSLCNLLLLAGEGELLIEINRKMLAEQPDFEPYSTFRKLDLRNQGCIGVYEVQDFLTKNNEYVKENEI